ncbi:glycosyltransferase family protein [Cyclobacterium amurskyense]|uniref:Glycosyltransferase n=1 Tax=Cyclobacterium amurskyense TaxID=320787 RepID=A0A0H4PHU6_9BACT|nr:glycosyltransferase [Cyclobacterium amurskyense]AKP52438.1 hypothetical protein CA2015_3036 [Cyclobacterium amurskyense]
MKKVLFLLDHAPNYRESFLRELAQYYELTVIAHPCERDNLTPPFERVGYNYIELRKTIGKKLRFNFELPSLIRGINPDVICVALNPRYPIRVLNFLFSGSSKVKWVWWGQIFGRTNNFLLDYIRIRLLKKSFGTLVYSDDIAKRLKNLNVVSFDNSQFSVNEFHKLENKFNDSLNFLFVGRPQKRKNLEFILNNAHNYPSFSFRLVGPGMIDYFKDQIIPLNVKLFDGAHGDLLLQHFKWSNIVINPGHVGLLVMNAACHCRPIIINSDVNHAPEVILAKEADQFFLNFNDRNEVESLFLELDKNHTLIKEKGEILYTKCINKYTIEKMAEKHKNVFDKI